MSARYIYKDAEVEAFRQAQDDDLKLYKQMRLALRLENSGQARAVIARRKLEERFWSRVDKTSDGCWDWLGSRTQNGNGYGSCHAKAVLGEMGAHRVAWVLTNGPIPQGMNVLHKPVICDNKKCVRPDHLYLGTQAQNLADYYRDYVPLKERQRLAYEAEHGIKRCHANAERWNRAHLKHNGDGTIALPLSRGQFALIDEQGLALVVGYLWTTTRAAAGNTYASRRANGASLYMHHVFLPRQDGLYVRHVNHDGLDNRRSNLAIATWQAVIDNRRPRYSCSGEPSQRPNKTGVKYVRQTRSGYVVQVRRKYIGYYKTLDQAARAAAEAQARLCSAVA